MSADQPLAHREPIHLAQPTPPGCPAILDAASGTSVIDHTSRHRRASAYPVLGAVADQPSARQ